MKNSFLSIILLSFCTISCNEAHKQHFQGGDFTVGRFTIRIIGNKNAQPELFIFNNADTSKVLLQTVRNVPFFTAAIGKDSIKMVGTPEGSFEVKDKLVTSFPRQTIDDIVENDSSLILIGKLYNNISSVSYHLSFTNTSTNQLSFHIAIDSSTPKINRIFLRYASTPDERFFGFGEQLTYFDQKGKVIPIMVQEHGVGRGKPIVTQFMNLTQNHGGGNPYITGIPAPHYITSKMHSLFLENKEYSEFNLRAPDRVQIKLFSNEIKGRIIYGTDPKELIKEYTSYCGRMRALPDWVNNGAIVCLQGGTDAVNKKYKKLDEAGVPMAGVWLQDWCGVRYTKVGTQLWWNWKLDDSLYNGYHEMVNGWQRKNIRPVIYINPFLTNAPGHNQMFSEAQQKGYLVRQQNDSPYLIKNTDFSAGLIDLSNPDACTWIKQIIKTNLIDSAGSYGWMCDFGEALPFNAKLFNNADPYYWHNHYTERWAEVNRQAIDEAGKGKEIVFFNRSGYAESPKYSTAFWLGDQTQTWDEYDGIKTAVTGMLSGGMSGFSLFHGDVGGYSAFALNIGKSSKTIIGRNKDLEWRWEELGAFYTMYRTHEGLNPKISVQVYDDTETIAHFSRTTKLFKALSFYRKQLVNEAAETGLPVVRHPFIEFPSDVNVFPLKYQFMYGSELMVAPVLDARKTSVRLYLPEGSWVNVWTGETMNLSTGHFITVAAPFGKPAMFLKAGSAVGEKLIEELKAAKIYNN